MKPCDLLASSEGLAAFTFILWASTLHRPSGWTAEPGGLVERKAAWNKPRWNDSQDCAPIRWGGGPCGPEAQTTAPLGPPGLRETDCVHSLLFSTAWSPTLATRT